MDRKVRIAVLVSGGGTNLQALIDAQHSGVLRSGEIVVVVSSKAGVYALERAKNAGIDAVAVSRKDAPSPSDFEAGIIKELEARSVEVIILAGFMSILSEDFTKRYADRIINVHPALIPSFCGKGYYGLKVHEEALTKGVKVSGATVHLVNEICDGGEILAQKAVAVLPGDTPEKLQRRIMEQAEWKLLPEAAEMLCNRILSEGKDKPKTPEVTLRKWEISDAEAVAKICDTMDRRWLGNDLPSPYTADDGRWFLENVVFKNEGVNGIWRAVVVDGEVVANISVEKKQGIEELTGEIGYYLRPEFQNLGIMTEAAGQICELAFSELGIVRIVGRVFEPNIASRRVLEKAGFEREGIMKNAFTRNGNIYNGCIYAKLKED